MQNPASGLRKVVNVESRQGQFLTFPFRGKAGMGVGLLQQGTPNCRYHGVSLTHDLIVPKAQNTKSCLLEEFRTY